MTIVIVEINSLVISSKTKDIVELFHNYPARLLCSGTQLKLASRFSVTLLHVIAELLNKYSTACVEVKISRIGISHLVYAKEIAYCSQLTKRFGQK